MTNRSSTSSNKALFRQSGTAFGIIFVATVCVLTTIAVCPIQEKVILATWMLVMGIISIWLFNQTAGNPTLNRLASLTSVGLTFAFPFKAVLSQCTLSEEQRADFFIPPKLFSASLMPAVAYTSGAILALTIAVIIWRKSRASKPKPELQLNFPMIFLAIAASIVVKFVAQYILIWGVPNVPSQNNIPFVTGAVAMFVKLGIFHLINVAIAAAIISRTSKINYFILAILAMGYLGLDFGIGSKYSLIYVLVAGIFSVAISTNQIRFSWQKLTLMVAVAFLAVSLYPIIHNYRFAKRRSAGRTTQQVVMEAVEMALLRTGTDQNIAVGSVLGVAKRVNGFQNHAAAVLHRNSLGVTWRDMISSAGATQNYTRAVTGIQHESNAFGITQSGMMTAQCDEAIAKIFCGSFALNFFLYIGSVWVFHRVCKSQANWYAVGVSGGLFLVYFQFQGGNLAVVVKQLIVIAMTAFVSNYMFKKKRRRFLHPQYVENPNYIDHQQYTQRAYQGPR